MMGRNKKQDSLKLFGLTVKGDNNGRDEWKGR